MQTNNKMAVAPVGRLIWQMSIPPLISMFLQYSYNLIDSAFVARLSENALTAVSLSFPITTLMNATSIWIGVGVNVLIAGYLGEKKQDEANTTVTHGLLLAFGIGALLNLLSLLIMKPYFWAFTNNEEIYQLSLAYMSVCSFMQIPNMVHIAIQKMIQATGNMIAPMWFQIAGVVVNFVFDPLLIFGIGVFPAMGIRGAAVATVAGYLLSMILAFALLLGKKQKVRIKIKEFHIQKWMIARIFALGLPSFIMNALSSFMVTFVNLFLVAYSDTAIAFFGAYFKVQQLVVMTVNGLIQGCLPIMRFNYGAGNRDRLHSAFRYGTALVSGMMILGTLTVILFPAQLLGLFTASEAMRSFGISAMRIMAVSYLFCGWSTMISTYLQATEQVFPSMLIQLLRQFLLLIPFMWGLEKLLKITGIWLSFPVTETATFVLALLIFRAGRKKKRFAAVQKHSKNRKRRDDMEIHIKKGLDALQTETVLRLLSQTVWACNRKKEAIMESWKHSICYGAYTADGKQIGFARVITDYATQYYICDVVVDADFRHRGVGASLLKVITAEDTYRSLLGMLITEEAEQFYEPFGFRKDPICFMTRKETPEAITNE